MGVREFLTTFAAGTELRYENENENQNENEKRKTKDENERRELKR